MGITTLTASATGNTVNYSFGGLQTVKVPAASYYNLTLSTSGTKTLAGALNIDGNISIGTGTTLDASGTNYPISLKGSWISAGTFNEQQGKVTFSGAGAQPIINSLSPTETFYDLEFNTTGPVTSNVDLAVTHNLTMTNGVVLLPGNTITLGISGASPGSLTYTSGWISGTFSRWAAPSQNGTDLIFPIGDNSYGRNLTLNFTNITAAGLLSTNFIGLPPTTGGLPLYEDLYVLNLLFPEGYWNLIKDGTFAFTGTYDLSLIPSNFITYPVDGTTRTVARLTAGNWILNGNHVAGNSSLLRRSGLTSFSNNFAVAFSETCSATLVNCPASPASVNNIPGTCANTVTWIPPTMSVPCPTFTITSDHVPGESFTVGVHPVTYKLMNGAIEVESCTFNVTVTDNQVPTIIPPAPVAVGNTAGLCGATGVVLGVPTTADNCTVASVTNNAPVTFPFGPTTVTWTVTDGAGNSATATQTVTVSDNELPVALCKNISVNLDALGNATITAAQVDNGSSDNCGISTMTVAPDTFNSSNIGPNNVTLTVTDIHGNVNTCVAVVTIVGTLPSTAYYSYQTGNWNQASTWTPDPGGTTGPGTTVPGNNDKVVILSGRTVTLTANVAEQNLDVTINNGGILDQSTFAFTNASGLAALKGGGVLKLSSPNFPAATLNTFVTTDAGTTEYNNNGSMSATQAIYYHLVIRTPGIVTQLNNITLNGNLDVKQGTFQINDATARRLSLIINGNVTVDNTGLIAVGTGATTVVTNPLGILGSTTPPFRDYYELHSHRIQIFGDFTNNGTVRFSNLSNPVYNLFPLNGFATVYFQGSNDNSLTCNGQTDFYNLILDKGSDQTYKLTVYSAAYNRFRLFGANTSAGDNAAPATNADPNLKKALWIKNGSLVLQGLLVIPSLSEGATAGPPSSDFFVPSKGSLVLDGAGVIVLSTADDFNEVNAAYNIAGGSNAAYGINTSGGNSGLSILGKLQVNDGYLSTRESSGLMYWSYAPGQFILNGGTVDAKQFHSSSLANSLISYSQTGGTLLLRGRFQRTTSVFTPLGLANAPLNTTRLTNSIDGNAGSLSITNSGNANGFSMSGGNIRIFDVCGSVAPTYAFQVLCAASGINVTGGTVEIDPTTGTGTDANYLINSTAPLNNLIINRASGASTVQLNTNPLVVRNDLTLTSGVLDANNLDVTVGGNYSVASGTTYTTGTNNTIFNGAGLQTFTVDLAAPLTLNKLTIDKASGIALDLAGTQSTLNVTSDFRLVLGTLNDNGKTINIAGNIYNSGIHTGSGIGKITLNGTVLQSIDGNGIFRNVELNNTNAAADPVSLLANITLNGLLTFSQDKLFNINTFNVTLNSTSAILNGGPLRYMKSAGNAGDGGLTKVYSSPGIFNYPIGVVSYTPASIGLSSAPAAYGSITVIPVNFAHPNVTTPGRSLTYFWRVKSAGFTLGSATITHGYTYDQANVVTGADISEDQYVAARFDLSTNTWTNGTTADIDVTNNIIGEPGAGNFLENVTFIDGDYTAGDNNPTNPFGTPTIYYSRINGAGAGSGLWSNVNTWSIDPVLQHTGAPAASVPGVSDIVIIGALDSVYLATNNTVPNTDVRSCASLKIEKGSALDIGYNFNSSFGMVISHPNGNGNFRLTTSWTSGFTFTFPSGDFTDFNVNLGTTELYSTNPAAGTTYWLPNGILSYGNLIIISPRWFKYYFPE